MTKPNSQRIIELIETPVADGRPLVKRIERSASSSELIEALREARSPLVRQVLCDILGRRHERSAVPALIAALNDDSRGVRSSAADAIAKIGSIRGGPGLLRHFTRKGEAVEVKQMLAAALGAVGYKPAVPSLVRALNHSNSTLRGCAAWSLGALKAIQAKGALEQALAKEKDPYAGERLREALDQVTEVRRKKPVTRRAEKARPVHGVKRRRPE